MSSESPITRGTSGESSTAWVGVVSGRWDGRASETKRRSAIGAVWRGQRLKKSRKRRADDRLHRRKRYKSAAASGADLVAAGQNSSPAIQLQLGHAFGGRRHHLLQLLFPPVQGIRKERRSGGLSGSPATPHCRAAANRLGPPVGSPKPHHERFYRQPEKPPLDGIPPRLRAGTQPGGIHLGVLEAACLAQCLPKGLLGTGRNGAPDAQAHASQTAPHHRLLATG